MYLWEKHNWYNKTIPYLINRSIVEYDIKSAGFNILKGEGVFSDEEILLLNSMEKLDRNIYIGKKLRSNPKLNETLMDGFVEIRRKFFLENKIKPENVLAIKKDAIFVIEKSCRNLTFNHLEFIPKSKFTSFYYINNIEFLLHGFYNKKEVKGISKEIVKEHDSYFLKYLFEIMFLNEDMNVNISSYYRKLRQKRDMYINRQLPIECYKEFNFRNSYLVDKRIAGTVFYMDAPEDFSNINIMYNYQKYIIPLLKMVL